jgi:hypothetical protein
LIADQAIALFSSHSTPRPVKPEQIDAELSSLRKDLDAGLGLASEVEGKLNQAIGEARTAAATRFGVLRGARIIDRLVTGFPAP